MRQAVRRALVIAALATSCGAGANNVAVDVISEGVDAAEIGTSSDVDVRDVATTDMSADHVQPDLSATDSLHDPFDDVAADVWIEIPPLPGFVWVPAGEFDMGSPDTEPGRYPEEGPVHHVVITRGFYVKATEVTQAEWSVLMGNNPSYFQEPAFPACPDCPVEQVNWWDALSYCNALSAQEGLPSCYALSGCTGEPGDHLLCTNVTFAGLGCAGYRLLTEAEWEYAARAGTTTSTYNGVLKASQTECQQPSSALDDIAWFCGNAGDWPDGVSHPVGLKQANAFGLYDSLGNVWEWTWDWYGEYVPGVAIDPMGPDTGEDRTGRGGSWLYFARHARSANRGTDHPEDSARSLGMRIGRTGVF